MVSEGLLFKNSVPVAKCQFEKSPYPTPSSSHTSRPLAITSRQSAEEDMAQPVKSANHMSYFSECRNESLNHVANQTNNL